MDVKNYIIATRQRSMVYGEAGCIFSVFNRKRWRKNNAIKDIGGMNDCQNSIEICGNNLFSSG